MTTFRERQELLMKDLLLEKEQYPEFQALYERKIAELREAMGEPNESSQLSVNL